MFLDSQSPNFINLNIFLIRNTKNNSNFETLVPVVTPQNAQQKNAFKEKMEATMMEEDRSYLKRSMVGNGRGRWTDLRVNVTVECWVRVLNRPRRQNTAFCQLLS